MNRTPAIMQQRYQQQAMTKMQKNAREGESLLYAVNETTSKVTCRPRWPLWSTSRRNHETHFPCGIETKRIQMIKHHAK